MNFFDSYNGTIEDFYNFFQKNKCVLVRENTLELNPDIFFRKLASQCGIPLIHDEDPISGKLEIGKWSVIEYNPNKADTYKYSNTAQPLHIDYSYFSFDIYAAFIFCEKQAEFGGATRFIDVDIIVDILQKVNTVLFEKLQETQVHFGRTNNPATNKKAYILSKDDLGWKINWNYYRAKSDVENLELVEAFKFFLDMHIENSGELTEIKLKPGEGVFFHDKRVLHGRNSFIGGRLLNKGGIAISVPDYIKEVIEQSK